MFLCNAFNYKVKLGRFLVYTILLLIVLAGCNTGTNTGINTGIKGNPTPKDFLGKEEADIFVLDSIVYSNAQNIEWVQKLDYTVGEQIGEITKQSDKAGNFTSGTSNKLPVGTKIYKAASGVYIAIVEGVEIPYLAMIEG